MLADSLKIFKTELLQLCPDTGSASDGNDQLWATATTAWTRLEKLKEDLGRGRGGWGFDWIQPCAHVGVVTWASRSYPTTSNRIQSGPAVVGTAIELLLPSRMRFRDSSSESGAQPSLTEPTRA